MIFQQVMRNIAKGLDVVGILSILIILVVTTADAIMNKVFSAPFTGATEVVTSVMPISVFAFLLSTQISKRHILIDVFLNRLGVRLQKTLKYMAHLIMIFLFGILTWLTVPFALYSFSIRECTGGIVAIPIYPAKLIIPIVTALITIQLIYELFRKI